MSSADVYNERGYPRQELSEKPLGTHSRVARVLVAVNEVVVEVVVTWIFENVWGFLGDVAQYGCYPVEKHLCVPCLLSNFFVFLKLPLQLVGWDNSYVGVAILAEIVRK